MSAPLTLRALLVSVCAVLGVAAVARADTVPPGAVVWVEPHIDATAFARNLTARYNVELRRVVVADIDHDGDRDVVAATDQGLLLWVNDGRGRLTSQAPTPGPPAAGDPLDNAWRRRTSAERETIQNSIPALRQPPARWSAAPIEASASNVAADPTVPSDRARGPQSPRAPPAAY